MRQLKKELYNLCIAYVQNRMDNSLQAIKAAQQASQDDTKSSAGDKYETGRAMMQQETDRNQTQLNESNKLMVSLNRISTDSVSDIADAGSLVITNGGKFYLAISAGALVVNGETYFAVSPSSPIGLQFKGQKAGHQFSLNSKNYIIENII